jgi:hypothetical protein
MQPLQAINAVLPLAFTSGVNLYLTVLVVGLSVRYGWIADVPPSLHVLASPPLITCGTCCIRSSALSVPVC